MSTFEYGKDGAQVVVVGLDGSESSWLAAAYAGGLARRQHARLVVVYVETTPAMAGLTPGGLVAARQAVQEVSAALRATVEERAAEVGVEVTFLTGRGEPAAELARVADEVRADAVVVGASASTGHRLVGSTAVRLVRDGRWPVTVVP